MGDRLIRSSARTSSPRPAAEPSGVQILRRQRTDADYYELLGPFLARREVAEGTGAPLWDEADRTWFVARIEDRVVGFVAAKLDGSCAILCSAYVVPGTQLDAWDAMLDAALAAFLPHADEVLALVAGHEIRHYQRARRRARVPRWRFMRADRAPEPAPPWKRHRLLLSNRGR